jgi:hypothetical protein
VRVTAEFLVACETRGSETESLEVIPKGGMAGEQSLRHQVVQVARIDEGVVRGGSQLGSTPGGAHPE